MSEKRKYDSTVARIAGNILSGMFIEDANEEKTEYFVKKAVAMARAVVAEVERTEPQPVTVVMDGRIWCAACGQSSTTGIRNIPHRPTCPCREILNRNAEVPSAGDSH